jgi:predicted transposase/invertase (TIGR01784 family)
MRNYGAKGQVKNGDYLSLGTYINPFTDYGFKLLFGTEANKELLIDFLNCCFMFEYPIIDITYKNVEQLPSNKHWRKAIFDLYCVDSDSRHFIIEMQKGKLVHFKDRAIFYSSFPINSQAPKGEWNFKLAPVYHLAILDFLYEEKEGAVFKREVQLKDQFNQVFYSKFGLIILQMPVFDKKLVDLQTRFDKWCYFLKNLETFEVIPALFLQDENFKKMLTISKLANLPANEVLKYRESRERYESMENYFDAYYADGKQAGIDEMTILLEQANELAEQERMEKEQERMEKEQLLFKSILKLNSLGLETSEIAITLGVEAEYVLEVVEKNK